MSRKKTLSIFLCLGFLILRLPIMVLAQDSTNQAQNQPSPEILAPLDGVTVPRPDDPSCPKLGPCRKINVEGSVPKGYWPFLAVAPINASPRIWIQPAIITVKKDGTFIGFVYLGSEHVGAGEKYNIFVFAHKDQKRFSEGEVLMELPKDCLISDSVTVLRSK